MLFLAFPSLLFAKPDQIDALWTAMRMQEFVEVLSEEGRNDAQGFSQSLFPDSDGQAWENVIQTIYNPATMARNFKNALAEELATRDISGAIKFFQSDLGKRSIELEITARNAMLDPDIEGISRDNYYRMRDENDPALSLIRAYADANDLVDENVVGTMNGNYAFLKTLADEGQGPFADDPGAILNEIWSQEEEIRAETIEWVMSYYSFCYQPLSQDELRGLIEFSKGADAQRLNSALFSAFNTLFVTIAAELARESAQLMKSERL